MIVVTIEHGAYKLDRAARLRRNNLIAPPGSVAIDDILRLIQIHLYAQAPFDS